jgi:PAS domain S-box-containing protein
MWVMAEHSDSGLVLRHISERALAELGFPPDANLVGQPVAALAAVSSSSADWLPRRLAIVAAMERCAVDGDRATVGEGHAQVVVEAVDGSSRWVVVRDDDAGLLEEATARAGRERALLDAFIEQAPVLAFVTSATGRIELANQLYASVLNRTRADVIGRTNEELFGADASNAYQARNALVIDEGRSIELVETREHPDGHTHTYMVNLFPVPGATAGERSVGGIVVDITPVLTAEAKLAESEVTLKRVLESVNNGVWIVGPDWKTTYANPALARMLGTPIEELLGRQPTDFIRPGDVAAAERSKVDREAGASGEAAPLTLVRSDGALIEALGSSSPLMSADGRFRGAVAVIMDVTGQARAEAEKARLAAVLQETQKLESLGVLAGGVAHDFNNLLTGVIGNVRLVRDDLPTGHPAHEGLSLIEMAAARATDLCRQMLAYSGRGGFIVKPQNVSEVVGSTVELLRSSIDKRHLLRLSAVPDLPLVVADASQIAQVTANLVLNASEAIGQRPGTIHVVVSRQYADRSYLDNSYLSPDLPEGDYIAVDVSDDGEGMSEEVRGRLFEPFFTTRSTGRGLGLSAVLGIVRGHRGAVRVYSEQNRGTTVRVFFPAMVPAGGPVAAPPTKQRVGEGKVVVIVDDEMLVRMTLRRVLSREGFMVVEAADGQEGVECVDREARVDVVLLDLSMPRLDGAAAFREIRKRHPTLPVVLMSGFNEDEAIRQFLGKGLAGFIQKPFTPAAILACIKEALDGQTVGG